MGMAYADFSKSSIRLALKRGLARQIMAQATEGDIPQVIAQLAELRPNRKAQERLAERLQRQRGIVRVTLSETGLVITLRNRRQMISRIEDSDAFTEETLFYTRISARMTRTGPSLHVSRASFSCHALERLVERSAVALDCPLLPAVDSEAVTILWHAARARLIEDGEEEYAPALQPGVWAGRVDLSEVELEWGLSHQDPAARVPVFSARTFLAPEQMRPTVWLRWKADPSLSLNSARAC